MEEAAPIYLTPGLPLGAVLDERYRVESLVGRGGFGAVYRAFDTRLRRQIALKVLRLEGSEGRFRREAHALARLAHPGIVTVFDAGETGDIGYIAMELVEGESLATRLHRELPPWDEMAAIGAEVASALEHAHSRGIVHRDIKPGNILLTSSGGVKVSDFGTARIRSATPITTRGFVHGTMGYIAPEILRGGEPEPPSDLYSLGVCLYEGFTGHLPHQAENIDALVQKILREDPAPITRFLPDFPTDLADLVDGCLRKKPDERPAGAGMLEHAIRGVIRAAVQGEGKPLAVRVPLRLSTRVIRASLDGQRKRVVVLHLREGGLGDLAEEWPTERIREYRRGYLSAVFPVVERFGGKVEEVGEEGLTVLFGLPRTGERDEQRALHCALAIRETLGGLGDERRRRLRWSAGVGLGHAVPSSESGGYLVLGEGIRIAVRLAEHAAEGEIAVTQAVHDLATSRFDLRSSGEMRLPGAERASAVYALIAARQTGRLRIGEASVVGLVGRDGEMAYLQELAGRALSGEGQVLSVSGEAGIGKTRLLEAFLAELTAGRELRACLVGGIPVGSESPLCGVMELAGAFLQVLAPGKGGPEDLLPWLEEEGFLQLEREALATLVRWPGAGAPAEPPGEERREILATACRKLVDTFLSGGPSVLVVEDLQHFDPPSLDILREVLPMWVGRPALAVLLHRSAFNPGFGGLPHLQTLTLQPLRPESDAPLVCATLGTEKVSGRLTHFIRERAEGNPLYAGELLRMMVEHGWVLKERGEADLAELPAELSIPVSVEDIISARVEPLPPAARRLLQIASVLGREFLLSELQEVAGKREPLQVPLRDLTGRALLREVSLRPEPFYRFHHALTRDTVYAGIVRGRRREFHRRAAEALERLHPDPAGEELDRIAWHWSLSDRPAHAVRALRAAASANAKGLRSTVAVEQYRRALDIQGEDPSGPDPGLRTDLLLELGDALDKEGVFAEARSCASEALETALALGDEARVYTARMNLGFILYSLGHFDEAEREYSAVAEKAREDPRVWGEYLLKRAAKASYAGRTQEALAYLREAQPLVLHGEEEEQRAHFHRNLGVALYDSGDVRGSIEQYTLALEGFRRRGNNFSAVETMKNIAVSLMALGRYRDALSNLEEAKGLAGKLGTRRGVMSFGYTIGYIQLQMGRLEEARESLTSSLESAIAVRQDFYAANLQRYLGHCHLLQADYQKALELLRESSRRKEEAGDEREMHDAGVLIARTLRECGRSAEALPLLEAARESAVKREDPFQECEILIPRAAVLADIGRTDEAHQDSAKALEIARRYGEPETLIPALVGSAALSSPGEAGPLLEEALEIARRTERKPDETTALLLRGRFRLASGDVGGALADGEEALRIAEECGLLADALRARWRIAASLEARGEKERAGEMRLLAEESAEKILSRITDPALAETCRSVFVEPKDRGQ